MKLVYFDAQPTDNTLVAAALPGVEVETVSGSLADQIALARDAEIISVFVDSPVTAEMLTELPRLKLIAARSAGVDHIDLAECKKRGITVVNTPHYGDITVAEHTFALILALSRKIFQSYERTERMDFSRVGLQGFDLQGKTLGVIGVGNIGQQCIRIAHGFQMNVLAYDVKQQPQLAEKLDFTYTDNLTQLLEQSDIVSLHVPYLPQTHHILNQETIKHIKPGALIINTARGGLIDTQALLWALEEKLVGGVALDVLEGEHDTADRVQFLSQQEADAQDVMTVLRNHILITRDDVLITPHNAFNSREAVQRIFETTVINIQKFLEGSPVNVVT